MKYTIIKLFLILLLIPGINVFADENIASTSDFLFKSTKDPALYPEISYQSNPSVLCGITDLLMISNIYYDMIINETELQRLDDSIGKTGGTGVSSFMRINPDIMFDIFFPLKNKSLFGAGLKYNSDNQILKDLYTNYNSFTEKTTELSESNPMETGLDLYYALRTKKRQRLGFIGGYMFNMIPKTFTWVTDESISPSLRYVKDTFDPIDETSHTANAAVSMGLPISNLDLSFILNYTGIFKNRKNEFIAIDTDADGYNDSVVSYAHYAMLAPEAGGPADPNDTATAFDQKDFTIATNINFSPCLIFNISKTADLIFNGNYRLFDFSVNDYYKHIISKNILIDGSWLKTEKDSGLINFDFFPALFNKDIEIPGILNGPGSFDVFTGLILKRPNKRQEIRAGLGYSMFNEIYSQDGDSIAGASLFSSANVNNYTEANLGINPENNSIKDSAGYPSSILEHKFILRSGFEWNPIKDLTLYTNFDVSASTYTKTYCIYNLDTRSVWTESETSSSIGWKLDSIFGVAFPVGKNMICSVNFNTTGTAGDFLKIGETKPYDLTVGKYTEDGTSDLVTDTDFNFEVNIGFIITR